MVQENVGFSLAILAAGFMLGGLAYFLFNRFRQRRGYFVDFSKGFYSKGLPMVPMIINGEEKFFLLDSGANGNHLNKKYFDTLDVEGNSESHEIHGHSGVTEAQLFECTLSNNGYVFEDVRFFVMDIMPFNDDDYGCDIVGILGAPFLNKYNWSVDFGNLVAIIK